MYSEVGMNEHETSRFIRQTLEGLGLDVHGPIAGTGLYVDIEGSGSGGMVGYRADIDALPAQDQKRVSYRSQNPNVAHLCGHDAHTASASASRSSFTLTETSFRAEPGCSSNPTRKGFPAGPLS
jgi:metal-dependent amidase/aminoacylase/carboxypeptidase family protein